MSARLDDISPRTGMVMAMASLFLVFGFMFTVSGVKGETPGDVPLIAIGPAICLPGVAAIFIANATKGCAVSPFRDGWLCKQGRPRRADGRSREDLTALPSCERAHSGEDSRSTVTTVGETSRLVRGVDRDEVLHYLQDCYPSRTFLETSDKSSSYALERRCPSRESMFYEAAHYTSVQAPSESIVVFSRCESNSHGSYCCYIPPQDFSWDVETVV
ncbi:transmembrane protein 215-like [Brienomyrus brachyistius]|uniref:transmembrane protein 215-like n=1 Tax=Brienomyrus brachyistius TaxID=42636 RepID=UPI0020B2B42E|nr:transmembrane protein 215-like [Brienomyrus brachyistius]